MFCFAGGQRGDIRGVKADLPPNPSSFAIGGGDSNFNHLNVLDMITPDGVDQSTVLDYTTVSSPSDYEVPFISGADTANSIKEALAGNGPVTTAHFEKVKQAYETESAIEGTGGLVPDYDDLRSIAREVQN